MLGVWVVEPSLHNIKYHRLSLLNHVYATQHRSRVELAVLLKHCGYSL